MSDKKYSAIVTRAGSEKIAAAAISGVPVGITQMAVGDGGGALPVPSPVQTMLINELYRAPLNRLEIADQAANIIRAEMIMPPQVGGFWLREVALFDDEGICLAVANLPESYKPLLGEGSGRFQVINVWIAVSSTADVKIIADPSVIIATVDEVNKAKNDAKDYTDDVISELDENIKDAISDAVASAVRNAWEQDNPVGTTRLFNKKVDPNKLWPWSSWVQAAEHLTLRTSKADGSDVGVTGGSDTATITRANLPNEQLNISGGTSQQDAQTLTTKSAGKHAHKGGMRGPGAEYDGTISGTDNDGRHTLNWTSEDGDHNHNMDVPAHTHTVSGKTDALGQGQAISIVEKHVLQMCWHRVA
ncbi:TPA: phage tail protein [Serratia fonticola]